MVYLASSSVAREYDMRIAANDGLAVVVAAGVVVMVATCDVDTNDELDDDTAGVDDINGVDSTDDGITNGEYRAILWYGLNRVKKILTRAQLK